MNTSAAGPDGFGDLHEGRLSEMVHAARLAGEHTMKYFGESGLAVESKDDRSPVTVADREAEALVRQRIAAIYGDDAVAGEEHADTTGTTGYRWIVDPIDGTKSFICGVPLYSTLLALEFEDQVIGGVIYLPAMSDLIAAAVGMGCWRQQGTRGWSPTRVRSCESIDGAVFVTSQVDAFADRGSGEAYREIERRASITRSWGDGYGYAMVATGRADLMIDPVCNAWDVAAVMPVVTEAGGRFTDWNGNATAGGGDGVGTAGGRLHEEVLRVLGGGVRHSV